VRVPVRPGVDARVTEVHVEENAKVQARQTVIRRDVAALKI
jgi:multidrug efflux pump subunit AcrA (membrane-fusion protein)